MATQTVNFGIWTLDSAQLNSNLVYNEGLEILDIVAQLSCKSNTVITPPAGSNGDAYIVATGATGDWAGKANYIAFYYNGWKFLAPKVGWRAFIQSSSSYLYWTGSSWTVLPLAGSFTSNGFEIKDVADATSKLTFNVDDIPTATTIAVKVPNANYVLNKQNLTATTPPTSSDDSADGYSVGSVWINVSTDKAYVCVDSTAGVSVWREMASATGAGDVLGPVTSLVNEIALFGDTTGDTIKGSGIYISSNKEIYSYHKVISEKSISYTLLGSDSGKVILVNSASNLTITLPQTTTETIANGFHCRVIRRGTGTVTFDIQGTDTIESKSGYVAITPRYGEAEVTKIVNGTPNIWSLVGDLG